jgi:hypothetical protein
MRASLELALLGFTFFVLVPGIAATIGYAAWMGKPKSFDREMYWTAFISTGAVSGIIIVYVQRHGETWPVVVQLGCLELGLLVFGVAIGFGVGIFAHRNHRSSD